MSLPGITTRRVVAVRALTAEECDLLEYAPPLQLAQTEARFVIGPWRRIDEYVVTHRRHGRLMVVSRRELAALGIDVDGPPLDAEIESGG